LKEELGLRHIIIHIIVTTTLLMHTHRLLASPVLLLDVMDTLPPNLQVARPAATHARVLLMDCTIAPWERIQIIAANLIQRTALLLKAKPHPHPVVILVTREVIIMSA